VPERAIVKTGEAHIQVVATVVPLDRNPANVYIKRHAPTSQRVLGSDLDRIAGLLTDDRYDAETLDWSQLRYQHTAAVRAMFADGRYAPATANRMLSALRGVLKECWRLQLMSAEDYQRAADLQAVRGSRLPRGHALKKGDVRALFDRLSADDQALSRRDTAILAIQCGAGLRRAEIADLDLDDVDRDTWMLRVRGKGNKERTAYLPDGARLALAEWLDVRDEQPGPLFWPVGKTGVPRSGRLTSQAITSPSAGQNVPESPNSHRTTCDGRSSAICWMPTSTSAPCSSSPATPR
jgi:site-specific recombinase XerC